MSPNWLGHIQRQAPRRSALTCRRRCSRLASEKAGIHPPFSAAAIRRSCYSKFPISNMVFTRLLRWASHERASALRAETAHCRSLISHSRLAVSLSCASELGGICSCSKKYTPLTFATCGEVASHTRVSAPFSGLRATGLRIVIPNFISRPFRAIEEFLRFDTMPSSKQRGAGRPSLCAPSPFPWYPSRGTSY